MITQLEKKNYFPRAHKSIKFCRLSFNKFSGFFFLRSRKFSDINCTFYLDVELERFSDSSIRIHPKNIYTQSREGENFIMQFQTFYTPCFFNARFFVSRRLLSFLYGKIIIIVKRRAKVRLSCIRKTRKWLLYVAGATTFIDRPSY